MGREAGAIWSRLESISVPIRRALDWFVRWADVFGLCFGGAALVLAFLHSANGPSANAWSGLRLWPIAQIAAVVLAVVCQAIVVVRGRAGQSDHALAEACREVAAYVDENCRRGKGVVGFAWERRETLVRNLEAIRARAASRDRFEQLADDERLGLNWGEFQRTPQYQAVAASPLYKRGGRADSAEVVGILAIDFLAKGGCAELEDATRGAAFASVVGICGAALDFKTSER